MASRRESSPHRETYERYIDSARWRTRRKRYLADNPGCQCCGRTAELHVHHRSYRNLGTESYEDLRTLCRVCHTFVHHIERRYGLRLDAATDLFVDGGRVAEPRVWLADQPTPPRSRPRTRVQSARRAAKKEKRRTQKREAVTAAKQRLESDHPTWDDELIAAGYVTKRQRITWRKQHGLPLDGLVNSEDWREAIGRLRRGNPLREALARSHGPPSRATSHDRHRVVH